MDSTINRAHQHASGAKRGEEIAIGRSSGGLSTKVHILSDAHGNPLEFIITAGQDHDMKEASNLIKNIQAESLIGDKGYDSEPLREELLQRGVKPIIPRKGNSVKPNPCFEQHTYGSRHTIENLHAKMKQFRAFATRYDKLKRNYETVVMLVGTMMWLGLMAN